LFHWTSSSGQGENLIAASNGINGIIDDAKADYLPENLNVSITNDQSDQTRTQVDELQNSIIFGVLLVVGVLLVFPRVAQCVIRGGGDPTLHVHELYDPECIGDHRST
jgi:multidrug efflux pump subunit AcrB